MNEIYVPPSQNEVDPAITGAAVDSGQNSRNSQLAQMMKELMEIFQSMILKGGNDQAWINSNLIRIVQKIT